MNNLIKLSLIIEIKLIKTIQFNNILKIIKILKTIIIYNLLNH